VCEGAEWANEYMVAEKEPQRASRSVTIMADVAWWNAAAIPDIKRSSREKIVVAVGKRGVVSMK